MVFPCMAGTDVIGDIQPSNRRCRTKTKKNKKISNWDYKKVRVILIVLMYFKLLFLFSYCKKSRKPYSAATPRN